MNQPLTSGPVVGDVTVHISGVTAIPSVLESLGVEPAKVFAEAHVDLALFGDPDNVIPITAVGRLIRECVAQTKCREFGLLVGQHGGVQSFGLVGLFVRFSPDVETALHRLARYQHLMHGGQILGLDVDGDTSTLRYSVHQPGMDAVDQIEDGALAIFLNVMRTLCGQNWLPREVRFAHRRPENIRPYSRCFQTSLLFDADQSALVFCSNWLHRPVADPDIHLQRLLQRRIDELEAAHCDDFPEQVRGVVRAGILTGHAHADDVAALFSMHRRTLTRRLAEFNTSFEQLVDQCRYETSRQMLESSGLDVKQIAAALDYADASAFTRAFRRWSGTTPAAWRAARNSPTTDWPAPIPQAAMGWR